MRDTRKPVAFLSHASEDKPRVRELARALHERGVETWLDEWEILPGDDIVGKINEGLSRCDVGLIIVSPATQGKAWVEAEWSSLIHARLEDGRGLIPVTIDDARPPELIRQLARVSIDDVDRLVDAIFGRRGKPPVAAAPAQGVTRILIQLEEIEGEKVSVRVLTGDQELAATTHDSLHPDVVRGHRAFLEGLRGSLRGPAEAQAASLEAQVNELGRALGAFCLPGEAGEAVAKLIDEAPANHTVEVIFESDSSSLLSLPFEALRLPATDQVLDGRVLALDGKVAVLRRPASLEPPERVPPAGPIKLLVAVGAPDEGQSSNSVLDQERELANILDAVEQRQRQESFETRILEVGHPEVIGLAAQRDTYHVLHLSCHGKPGFLELEDEEGRAELTDATQLLAPWKMNEGLPLPLVVLSSCHGGVHQADAASFAEDLLRQGVPYVVAMQTSVTDGYATHFARELYGALAASESILPSRALAQARRKLEAQRQAAKGRGDSPLQTQPEYATATLFVAGEERPLANHALDREPLRERPVREAEGAVPQLGIDDLIGRRRELRRVLRAVREGEGGRVGAVLTGQGGVGKSTIAGRAMWRLRETGFQTAPFVGAWDLAAIASSVGSALRDLSDADAQALGGQLLNSNLDDAVRIADLEKALARYPVVLVLDDFEQNLVTGGDTFKEPVVEAALKRLLQSAHQGRLLITCRYPVPGTAARLEEVAVGPLSPAATRKLILRLPALAERPAAELGPVLKRIGGHPRVLELVDALLQGGEGRLPHVTEKLSQMAKEEGLPVEQGAELDQAVEQSILLGARDILLEELQEIARQRGLEETLLQAAVSNLPVSAPGVAHMLADGPPGDSAADQQTTAAALTQLAALSLLHRDQEGGYLVHRWTAEGLARLAGEQETRDRLARAGRYRLWRGQNESHDLADYIEAIRNLLAAGEFDQASQIALGTLKALGSQSQTMSVAALATEILASLPATHPNFAAIADLEGRAHLALGLTERAVERYEAMLDHHRELTKREPERADYQRDLSVSFNKMGDLYKALGQGDKASDAFLKALQIAQRLAQAEPDRADFQRDLSVAFNRMGDLYKALGQGDKASDAFLKALQIAQRLAQAEPDSADYQRDLSVSFNKVGDLYKALGQGDKASDAFLKALQIRQRLAQAEPDRADFQRDLSVSFNKMGDLYKALGQGDKAREMYLGDLQIAQRLAQAEPDRADFQRDLSVSYERMGDLYTALGQGDQAREAFLHTLQIRESLAQAEPDRADYQRDLATSFARMAGISEGAEAARFITEAVALRRRVLALAPDQAVLVLELGITLFERFQQAEHQPSLFEAAVILTDLRRRDALEARFHELADQLAPIAAQFEAAQEKEAQEG